MFIITSECRKFRSTTFFSSRYKSIGAEGAKTPTGTARAEAPGLSAARETAEAVPVESVAPVAESDSFLLCILNRKKTADNFKFL